MKQTAHKGTTAKHAGTAKHTQGKGKHHPAKKKKAETHHHAAKKQPVHTAAKGHKVAKPRKLAQGDAQRGLLRLCPAPGGEAEPRQLPGASPWSVLADVACCPVLALAESLRLSGRLCGADDVLALYGYLASDADAGATILATLEAAAEYGLAGVRPLSFRMAGPEDFLASLLTCGDVIRDSRNCRSAAGPGNARASHACPPLILGLELPGPHAVLAERGRWWSWSQPWPPAAFPDAVIEEAWAVTWP